jgi:hypothetical protein
VPGRPLSDDPECELFYPVETHLATHHVLTLQAIERTTSKRYGRLMILQPRGGGKSTYCSVVFPSYYLGRNPGSRLILSSYGADLARRMGKRSRSIIRQPRYQRIFGCGLSDDSQAAERFSLTNGSEYMAFGILAGVIGTRGDGIVIDDPVSGREAAESEVQRDAVWDAYHDDLLPCLVPGGWIICVMTHWDEDDLAGRILPSGWSGDSGLFACRDGMEWEVLCLQAKCETRTDPLGRKIGEYLWPEWFDRKHWAQFEASPRNWNSLCQQRPRPVEGAFFVERLLLVERKRDDRESDYEPVAPPPICDTVFAVIDTAIKTGRDHDGTGVIFVALDAHKRTPHALTILDWDIHQIEGASLQEWLPSVFDRLQALAGECRPIHCSIGAFIEDKGSGMVLLQQAANNGWPAQAIDSKLSAMGKKERALNASEYVNANDVKFARHAYEKTETFKGATKNHLLSQVLRFNMGSKDNESDDLLDCFSYACMIGLGNPEGF